MELAGDIGGTKTHLAIFNGKKIVREEKYLSQEFSSLENILRKFGTEKVERACFGVAGPVQEGKSRITNLSWKIDVKEISSAFKIPHVWLINDLEATAWGIEVLSEKDFATLNVGKIRKGNRAVIAAGTGLGEAGLYWDGKRHHPFACEGGHADFAPRDTRELELWGYLHKKYGHVSYERLISGPGIEHLYWFLLEKKVIKEKLQGENLPRLITEKGIPEVLDWFASLFGGEAGNVALKFLATGGIFLGGGIAPHILAFLKKEFMRSFVQKGRFQGLLSEIPVKVILNERAALLGAAEYSKSNA
jgi:glucokinase